MNAKRSQQKPFAKWITKPEMLVGLSALLLSVCGLFISLYEASLIRQSARASTWPYVQVAASINQDGIRLWVENNGVGPARIHAAAVTYKGQLQAGWSELMQTVAGEPVRVDGYYSLINGRVLPANSQRENILALENEDGETERKMVALLSSAILSGELDVTICYSSVYDECWVSSLKDVLGPSRSGAAPGVGGAVKNCESAQRSGI